MVLPDWEAGVVGVDTGLVPLLSDVELSWRERRGVIAPIVAKPKFEELKIGMVKPGLTLRC